MVKKILIVLSIIILWENRNSIVPALESVVSVVVTTGSSILQSV